MRLLHGPIDGLLLFIAIEWAIIGVVALALALVVRRRRAQRESE
jgi:hypothetical protein